MKDFQFESVYSKFYAYVHFICVYYPRIKMLHIIKLNM